MIISLFSKKVLKTTLLNLQKSMTIFCFVKSIEDLKEGQSRPRNRAIASAFVAMKIIEQWGTGIPRIIEMSREYELPEPEFIEIGMDFRVNLYRKQLAVNPKNQSIHDKNQSIHDKNQSIQGENPSIHDKNQSIQGENQSIQDKNQSIEEKNQSIHDKNQSIEEKNQSIQGKNPSIGDNNQLTDKQNLLIHSIDANSRTKEKARIVCENLSNDTIFGRTEIMKITGLSTSAAGLLINKLKNAKLVVPVTGKGKGKYSFTIKNANSTQTD